MQAGAGALNLVLLHKASRVSEIELPQGTEIRVHRGYRDPELGGGDYTVYEVVPGEKEEQQAPEQPLWAHTHYEDYDYRPRTLQIDLESVRVQYIKSVQFVVDDHIVHRFRREKGMWD